MEHATLEEMHGDRFRREDRRTWELVFQMLIKAMNEGLGDEVWFSPHEAFCR